MRARDQEGDVTIRDERDQHRSKRVKVDYTGAVDADDGKEDGETDSSELSEEPDESEDEVDIPAARSSPGAGAVSSRID